MKKRNKKNLNFIIYFFFILFYFSYTLADENIIFLSLKNSKVNLRQGPSFDYPIKLIYKKKYLPVIILEKSDTWRKIKDFEKNSGWIHISQLSKKKSALNIKDISILYKNSTIYSKPVAKIESGRLVLIKKCKVSWCNVSSSKYKGWILKKYLWGKTN
jgi:SH3-like domain-containing protein